MDPYDGPWSLLRNGGMDPYDSLLSLNYYSFPLSTVLKVRE